MELVAAPLPGVAGSGFSDGSPRVTALGAADLTETGVGARKAAVSPHTLPRAAMTVATVSPDCLRGTTAAAPQVFKDPSRVPSGEAPVLSHSSRRDAAVAVVVFADCFRVCAETKLLVFTPSFLKLAAAVTGSAVCPPHERAGAAAAVLGCVPPRVAKVAAAVDWDPLLEGAFQRPDSAAGSERWRRRRLGNE